LINEENAFATVSNVKRFIGQNYKEEEVVRDRELVGAKVIEGPNESCLIELKEGEQDFGTKTPEDIACAILSELRRMVVKYLDLDEVADTIEAVITVPATFNEAQRMATVFAA